MNSEEFNRKWQEYLEEGHYGLGFDLPLVTEFLDKEFQHLSLKEDFKYSQIKLKFGAPRVYAEGCDTLSIEEEIARIIKKHYNDKIIQ